MKRDGSHVGIPCDRDAYGSESGDFEHVDQRPGRKGLSPCGFVILGSMSRPRFYPHVVAIAAITVQSVPQVPSGAHIPNCRSSILPSVGTVPRFRDGDVRTPGLAYRKILLRETVGGHGDNSLPGFATGVFADLEGILDLVMGVCAVSK